jgi:hypothetical protein
MAQLYCTGPVDLWIGFNFESPDFLGHSERGPSFQVRPQYSPVFVDLGGQNVPFDTVYDGEDAMVTVDLTRWNNGLLEIIQDKAGLTGPGSDAPGNIGTLMVTEGSAYQLYLHFPYAAKAAFSNQTNGALPAGYRFRAAFLETDDSPDLGTKAKKQHLVFHCLRTFDPSVVNAFGYGELQLFDFEMSGVSTGN